MRARARKRASARERGRGLRYVKRIVVVASRALLRRVPGARALPAHWHVGSLRRCLFPPPVALGPVGGPGGARSARRSSRASSRGTWSPTRRPSRRRPRRPARPARAASSRRRARVDGAAAHDGDVRSLVAVIARGSAPPTPPRVHRAEPRADSMPSSSARGASRAPRATALVRPHRPRRTLARPVMNPPRAPRFPGRNFDLAARGVFAFATSSSPPSSPGPPPGAPSNTSRSTTTIPSTAMRMRSSIARSSLVPDPFPPSLNIV